MKQKAYGFSIVELLIVIVVIAILAAISVVAYIGVQDRAANSQMVTVVRAYQTALQLYKADEAGATSYPQLETGMSWGHCLGTGYDRSGPNGHSNYCWVGPGADVRENATFNGLLSEYMSATPTVTSLRYYNIGNNNWRTGAVFIRGNYTTEMPRIEYQLRGANQDCGVAGAERASGNWGGSGSTHCRIILPID